MAMTMNSRLESNLQNYYMICMFNHMWFWKGANWSNIVCVTDPNNEMNEMEIKDRASSAYSSHYPTCVLHRDSWKIDHKIMNFLEAAKHVKGLKSGPI